MGTNYYAATFANSFLSRKAFLGAPEQCETTAATIEVQVPKAGKYLALVRYEAAYRFETQFTPAVEQNGAKKLDRLYGARDNLRIWAFREKLKKEVGLGLGRGRERRLGGPRRLRRARSRPGDADAGRRQAAGPGRPPQRRSGHAHQRPGAGQDCASRRRTTCRSTAC